MTIRKENMTYAQRPEELHQLFVAGVNNHDIDALLALYEQDAIAADLEGHLLQSTDDLRAFLLGFLAVVKQIDGGTRKVLVSGNIALMSSTYHAILAVQNGAMTSITGISAEVARRQPDGTWLLLLDDPQFVDVPAQSEHV
jgi:ketosteroid isomerase-like protein